MMRARLLELAARRARLAERARTERGQLAALVARGDALSAWLETGRRVLDEARRSPLLVLAAVAVLAALRPRRVLRLLAGGWTLWRLYRSAQRWWQRLAPPASREGA